MAVYETPGGTKFADTIVPYVKDCNTILLANHGTVTFGPDLEKAYWNSEIIDAYCKILILARQLGNVNYFTQGQTKELLELKKRLGYDDVRFREPGCAVCGDSNFNARYKGEVPQPRAFALDAEPAVHRNGRVTDDLEGLVEMITEKVMAALQGAGV